MSAVAFTAQRIGANLYRCTVDSYTPGTVLYWWVNGLFAARGKLPFYDVTVAPGEGMDVDCFNASTDAPEPSFPGRVTLEWENNASSYIVSKYIDGDWVEQARLRAGALGTMRWVSPVLEDDAEHQYAVAPIGADGNPGLGRLFTVLMVRRPDPPTLALAYDGAEVEATFT